MPSRFGEASGDAAFCFHGQESRAILKGLRTNTNAFVGIVVSVVHARTLVSGRAVVAAILFLVVMLSMGRAAAPDTGLDDGTESVTTVVTSTATDLTEFDIRNIADNTTRMGAQIDVNVAYWFWLRVNDDNNWSEVQNVWINLWFDGGDDATTYAGQTTGANYRLNLTYTNSDGDNTPETSEWSVSEGNFVYDGASSSVFTNTAPRDFSFRLAFTLNKQVRQAADPVNSGTTAYDDANSWNAQVRALDDAGNLVTVQQNAASVYFEFGVFQYTEVTISATWSAGSIAPGENASTNVVTVTHISNRDYRIRIWFVGHLTNGSNTISVTNVKVLAAGDATDDVTADTAFAGIGIANAIYVRGNSTTNESHDTAGDSQTTTVQLNITVPLGTQSGTYTATATVRVEQP